MLFLNWHTPTHTPIANIICNWEPFKPISFNLRKSKGDYTVTFIQYYTKALTSIDKNKGLGNEKKNCQYSQRVCCEETNKYTYRVLVR